MELLLEQAGMKLYQGDARAMLEIPDASVQLVVTSPPYYNGRDYSTWPSYAAYLTDMALAWQECYRVLVRGGRIAVVVPDGYGRPSTGGYRLIGDDTARGLIAAGFELRGKIIWDKQPSGLSTNWGSWKSATSPALRDCHEVILGAGKADAGQAATPAPAEDGHEVVLAAHKLEGKRERGENTVDKDTFLAATTSVWRLLPVRSDWHPAPFPAEIPRRLTPAPAQTAGAVQVSSSIASPAMSFSTPSPAPARPSWRPRRPAGWGSAWSCTGTMRPMRQRRWRRLSKPEAPTTTTPADLWATKMARVFCAQKPSNPATSGHMATSPAPFTDQQ